MRSACIGIDKNKKHVVVTSRLKKQFNVHMTHCVVSEQIMIIKKDCKNIVNSCKVLSLKLRASHDLVLFVCSSIMWTGSGTFSSVSLHNGHGESVCVGY